MLKDLPQMEQHKDYSQGNTVEIRRISRLPFAWCEKIDLTLLINRGMKAEVTREADLVVKVAT